MSHDVSLYGERGLLAGDARRTARSVSHSTAAGLARQAAVDAETDVSLSKIDAITTATGRGLGNIAKIAQLELVGVQNFPTASGRFSYIAERQMFAVGEVLDDLQTKLRRK